MKKRTEKKQRKKVMEKLDKALKKLKQRGVTGISFSTRCTFDPDAKKPDEVQVAKGMLKFIKAMKTAKSLTEEDLNRMGI